MSDPYAIPRHFNIAGPCIPEEHYMLDAIARLPEALALAENKKYFVIHAEKALRGGLSSFPASAGASIAVSQALSSLCAALDKPLIIFFDEADCLSGQVLIGFLRQLRDGYVNRDVAPFPWSVSLVGMRDIRDFKSQVRPDRDTPGSASPFNIVTKALTLGNFTPEQVSSLYAQHTEATGQIFEASAAERASYWSGGQPWLVNALARQAVDEDLAGDYGRAVTATHMDAAAEALMLRRDTHIDSLAMRSAKRRISWAAENANL